MKIVDGNKACSSVAYLFSEICSIYPITPSSPMAENIDYLTHTDKKNIFNDKLNLGYPIIFMESVFCGIIFYFAIKCYSKIGVISLIMGVVTFIVCGFEHSIANSAYLGISTQFPI